VDAVAILERIAKQSGCSRAAIIQRLKVLGRTAGARAGRLRRYSAQIERMEEELGDWRAKRIHRERLVGGEAR
jgi:hypothetical protein